ncbi:hypothetical protein Tco_0461035, partial [Tanacetum coccineum]
MVNPTLSEVDRTNTQHILESLNSSLALPVSLWMLRNTHIQVHSFQFIHGISFPHGYKDCKLILEQCSTTVLKQDSLSPGPQSQENVPQIVETVTTSNELELLYSPMFSELLNGTSPVVSKSSAVHAADNPDKRQQHNTTHTSTTTDVADPPPLNIHSTHQTLTQVPTVTAPKNITQAETNTENAQFDDDEFISIFSTS